MAGPELWPTEYETLREEARAMAATVAQMSADAGGPPTDVATQRGVLASFEVLSPAGRDELIGGVPCRVFGDGSGRATYLHFHGGGMVAGSPRSMDVSNADLATQLGVDVVSVDYRLAPEHPFPAGSDDCLAVTHALIEADDRPLVVGGESAGAYYAALTLLRVRDELGAVERIRGANLLYGVYDLSGTPSNFGVIPGDVPDMLGDDLAVEVAAAYAPQRGPRALQDPAISPLYAPLHDLPPALFTVGTGDHLLDDSLFLHARWRAWGNEAELALYPDCVHSFNLFPVELAHRANVRIAAFLDRCIAG